MPGYAVEAFELFRHYNHLEMPLAIARPGVSGVQVALILDQQLCR
jgi:hypothetical protein